MNLLFTNVRPGTRASAAATVESPILLIDSESKTSTIASSSCLSSNSCCDDPKKRPKTTCSSITPSDVGALISSALADITRDSEPIVLRSIVAVFASFLRKIIPRLFIPFDLKQLSLWLSGWEAGFGCTPRNPATHLYVACSSKQHFPF